MAMENTWAGKMTSSHPEVFIVALDSPDVDLPYPITNTYDPSNPSTNIIDFQTPLNVSDSVYYDPATGMYIFSQTMNGIDYLPTSSMTLEEYMRYQNRQSNQDYWDQQVEEQLSDERDDGNTKPDISGKENGTDPNNGIELGKGGLDINVIPEIPIEIRTQGSAEIRFGLNTSRTDNPVLPERQRRITTFDFDQQIQMNVTGKIGDLMDLGFNYNTEATFDFENQLNLNYSGKEDDIIELLEAGNVSMPLNSSLISGSQSLFGVKSRLRFGRLSVTTILAQDKGQKKEIEVSGGAQVQEFEVRADNYEENRHFYLNHYFYDTYDETMSTLPIPLSQVQIQRMEVWITNRTNDFEETRNIIALTDLGESDPNNMENASYSNGSSDIPHNAHNTLYNLLSQNNSVRSYVNAANVLNSSFGMQQGVDYEKLENARLLNENEYSYNSILGYVSLNQSLNNDEVLAVAYQYTYAGETYQVGEFSTDGVAGQSALYLKLLKSTVRNPNQKLWDLMMKNVYSLGAYQMDATNFRLDIWYNNPSTGIDINYIPKTGVDTRLLIQLLDLDRLNQQQALYADGTFDFLPINGTSGRITQVGTINPRNGRVYFTTTEPFGKTLDRKLQEAGIAANVRKTVVFQQLYDSTKIAAQQIPELNRYMIKGTYQSSVSSEIALNAFNIPQGSVQVTAGGRLLTEGSDYTVDYNLGRVKILNDGILSSGTPVKIALESNSLFSFQTKSLIGTHLDYKVSKDAQVGATIMRLGERPLTQKVSIGDEPVRNTMFGLDGSINKEVPFLTKLVDKIPGINTKAKSTINFSGEVAALVPGHNKAIGKEGISYIDDFEGSQSTIDIRSFNTWVLASVPQGQPDLFPEAELYDNLDYGKKRSKIGWYVVDPLFHNDNSITPDHIRGSEAQQDNRMRQVLVKEVFPNKELPTGALNNIPVFDLAYYPEERGPYNFDTDNVNFTDGKFTDPADRWGGIMRPLTTNDFESANIEYIQFWLMDPFSETAANSSNEDSPNTTGGDLYFNLGNVSEDILKDGRKAFENGIPSDGELDPENVATTEWGWIPTSQIIVSAFDNDVTTRLNQDVGLDGVRNDLENTYFADFLSTINVDPSVKADLEADPSSDNYHYFRGDDFDAAENDILERYKYYNNPEGNSPTSEFSSTLNADGYPTSATTLPNIEDINADNNLSESESYFQYKVNLRPQNMVVGSNFIIDKTLQTDERSGKQVNWYQFRIPIQGYSSRINGIQDFRSIRFIRMFMKGWSQEAVIRFARLELVRGEWRRYLGSLLTPGEYIQGEEGNTSFNVGAVNLEDNGKKVPVNYVTPNGIIRETNFQTANLALQNEQSLVMDVCGLKDGDANAAYRNIGFDIRNYNKIQMFVHAEDNIDGTQLEDDEATVFVRLGTDFNDNYYEYEMPLKVSPWSVHTPESVWPEENNMVIDLTLLREVKKERNNLNSSIFERYTVPDVNAPDRNITVVGNPNLQSVKTIMMGVRNPKKDDPHNQWQPDDGEDICLEVWLNELRLTDFNEKAGWATIGRMTAQLADFADVSLSGNYSSPGFGSIDKSVSERQQEHIYGFDASSTVQLGNFFGDRLGVKVPLYVEYSRNVIRPLYDPLNPDLILERAPNTEDSTWRDYLSNSIDLTERKAINFSNVSINPKRKDGKPIKPHFYNISNFSLNLAYNEINHKDINVRYDNTKNYKAGFNYSFSKTPKKFEPFKKIPFIRKTKWLGLIRDFNINLGPKQMGFSTNINRTYNEFATRYNFPGGENLEFPQFDKTFNWDRDYTFRYDLTRSLSFGYQGKNRAFINEPFGKVDYGAFGFERPTAKDSVFSSIKNFGRTMNYGHTLDASYKWPFKSFPLTDWISLTTRFNASFDWTQAPLAVPEVGNLAQNSRELSWNGRLTMKTLYNKIPYFKKVNDKYRNGRSTAKRPTPKKEDNDGSDDDPNKKNKKKDKAGGFNVLDQFARLVMSLDNVTGTYSTTDGIMLPGYNNRTEVLGLDRFTSQSPWEFVAGGYQEVDIFGRPTNRTFADYAYESGWMIEDSNFSRIATQYTVNHTEKLTLKASLKPITGLKIDLNADFNTTANTNSTLGLDDNGDFDLLNQQFTGMYSRSIITWKSAFVKEIKSGSTDSTDELSNATFTQMLDIRDEVSQMIGGLRDAGSLDPDSVSSENGYANGYNGTHQDVLIGSFIAAYTGEAPSEKVINPFRKLPLPNWRITYDGLSRIPFMQKFIKRLSFSHAYRSNMTIAGYTTNMGFEEGVNNTDLSGNVISKRQILQVSIMEQFQPLLGIDITLKNDLSVKFEYKKDRNISLGLSNSQITETKGEELTIGTGYKFKQLQLPIKFAGKKIAPSDLDLRLDISMRDNKTVIRKIVENQNQATAGQQIVSIKFSGSYQLTKQLMIRAYFDRVVNNPFISTSFPTANTNSGIALRFQL